MRNIESLKRGEIEGLKSRRGEKMRKESLKSMMILQVHDELIFEVPKEEIDHVKSMVLREMESALPLSVPIIVDWGIGDSWYEAH